MPDSEEQELAALTLPSAESLTATDASSLLLRHQSKVVAIIGPSDAGKTSLIASFYDLFQMGEVSGWGFSRSSTLHAFELVCHDARAASRRSKPQTPRTGRGEVRFYHLELARDDGVVLTLLLGDRAGEEYREASDNSALAATFPEIARANSIIVLVDGERLLDTGSRHNVRSEIRLILRALRDGRGLPDQKHLALVLTKDDLVRGSQHADRAAADFVRIVDDISRDLPGTFASVRSFKIAASPSDTSVARGTGVSELVAFWSEAERIDTIPDVAKVTPRRSFARLMPVREGDE